MAKVVVLLVTEKETEMIEQALMSSSHMATPALKNNIKTLLGKVKKAPRVMV